MEITIRPENMLEVLTNHGMDTIEAKAIVCDLLLCSDTEYVQRQQLKKAIKNLETSQELPEETVPEKEVMEIEDRVASYTPRKSKRINFSSLGGSELVGGLSK
jgi:hypothetical protein